MVMPGFAASYLSLSSVSVSVMEAAAKTMSSVFSSACAAGAAHSASTRVSASSSARVLLVFIVFPPFPVFQGKYSWKS